MHAGVRSCIVSYGPETLRADDGGMFALKLIEAARDGSKTASSSGSSVDAPAGAGSQATMGNLAFLQVALPNQIRISQVYENGGELITGYGYLSIRAPGGYEA